MTITSQRRFFPTGYGKEVTDRLFGLRRRAATGNHDFDRLCAELDIEHAERCAALGMVHLHSPGSTRKPTLGADRGYDAAGPVTDLRQACVTPHVAQKARYSAIDGRTTRHKGYALSLKHRKRIEEASRLGQDRRRYGPDDVSRRRTGAIPLLLTMAANNLARLLRLLAA